MFYSPNRLTIQIMKRTFSWTIKYVLGPLIPVIIAGIASYLINNRSFKSPIDTIDVIDPTLLAFSMIILCFTIMIQARNLSDKTLSEDICHVYILPICLFFLFFITSTNSLLTIINNFNEIVHLIGPNIQNTTLSISSNLIYNIQNTIQQNADQSATIDLIRWFSIALGIPTILGSIYVKYEYNLEDT